MKPQFYLLRLIVKLAQISQSYVDHMQPIKNKLLKFRTKRAVKKQATRQTVNYKDTKSIGILFKVSEEDKHDFINNFVHALEKDGKSVEALTYFTRDHDNPYDFKYAFFTDKDVSVMGEIKSQSVKSFMDKNFDYLYCITREDIAVFDHILSKSKAKCRIGKYEDGKTHLFEFMVNFNDETKLDEMIKEIHHFTKAIAHNT